MDVAASEHVERHALVVEDPLPPIEIPEHLVTVTELGAENHRPDHRIEPRAIAPAGEDPDAHQFLALA